MSVLFYLSTFKIQLQYRCVVKALLSSQLFLLLSRSALISFAPGGQCVVHSVAFKGITVWHGIFAVLADRLGSVEIKPSESFYSLHVGMASLTGFDLRKLVVQNV